MCTSGLLLFFLLLASSPVQPLSLPQPDTPEHQATIANWILSSLENITLYLQKKEGGLKPHLIMHLQILKVELKGAEEAMATDPVLQPLSQRTRSLGKTLEVLINKSIHQLNESDPVLLQEFLPIMQSGFWKLPNVWIHTDSSLIYHGFRLPESLLQDPGNECVKELLGTMGNSSQSCNYSEFCKNLVTSSRTANHYLSNQQYYFLLSRMIGCTNGIFRATQHYMNLYCANLMKLNQNAMAERYIYSIQDLFTQNVIYCGLAGFADFFNPQWLEYLLLWLYRPKGCFRRVYHCSVRRTASAAAVMGGFLYVLAKFPHIWNATIPVHSTTITPNHS